jgi:hypothetical protein
MLGGIFLLSTAVSDEVMTLSLKVAGLVTERNVTYQHADPKVFIDLTLVPCSRVATGNLLSVLLFGKKGGRGGSVLF